MSENGARRLVLHSGVGGRDRGTAASGALCAFLRKSGSWNLRVRGLAGLGTQRATESKRHGAKTSDRGVRAARGDGRAARAHAGRVAGRGARAPRAAAAAWT